MTTPDKIKTLDCKSGNVYTILQDGPTTMIVKNLKYNNLGDAVYESADPMKQFLNR